MAEPALRVAIGRRAAQRIEEHGWEPDLFSLLLGASGGPKWFILSALDKHLFGEFLARGRNPLHAVGSSIGAWRHACLAQDDPAAAVERLEQRYLHQRYSSKPGVDEISERSAEILEHLLGDAGARQIAQHPRIHTHIVTARGRGPTAIEGGPLLGAGMGMAGLSNAASRSLLSAWFQRVVFRHAEADETGLDFGGFRTTYARLTPDNAAPALAASGAIPFVLHGQRDIAEAPDGYYWDGGIIDYHFDLNEYQGDGLILYPHFRGDLTAGWFDKFLPWRRRTADGLDDLVLLSPSPAFVASLPLGKIPDRNDFTRLSHDERVTCWQEAARRSAELRDAFIALSQQRDPLAGVLRLG